MIRCGAGGNHTTTGLKFEAKTNLKILLNEVPNYRIDSKNNVLFKDRLVGIILIKYDLYKFLNKNNIKWQNIRYNTKWRDQSLKKINQHQKYYFFINS